MNAAILEAATRVLCEDGARGFNTNRVAEVAGVSVGSLYQYYPNKASLLFQVQKQETDQTWDEIAAILLDDEAAGGSPRRRAERAIARFFETEAAERELRRALQDAEVHYRDSAEFDQLQRRAVEDVRAFLEEAFAGRRRRPADLDFAARFFTTVVSATAEDVTGRTRDPAEVRRFARACSAMVCDHVGL
jgi:AcrR family transcriptional regulator